MTQQIISLDSQMLSAYQSCEQAFNYQFIQNLRTMKKAEALEKGDLIHRLLEVGYCLKINNINRENFRELSEAGLAAPQEVNHDVIRNFCDKIAPFYATRMELPEEEYTEILFHFNEYWDFYRNDQWHPLAVEEVGSKVLYESEDLKIIYTFKIDLVAELGKTVAPFDHKTSKRRQQPNSMSNQFIGYCFGLNLNSIVINSIGFQKTLKPKERFNRFILPIDNARIEEWKRNTVLTVMRMKEAHESGLYLMNFTSCNKYNEGCPYRPLCESSPESRLYKIDANYRIEETWDPAKKLEEVK